MLVELSVVEQRYQAVLAVIRDGVPVVEVARRFDVSRQAVPTVANLRSGTATNSSAPSYAPQTRRSARSAATAAPAELQSETV